MNIGKACAIFKHIESDRFTDTEKLKAIHGVASMETHNGITKTEMLDVLKWLHNYVENTKNAEVKQ